MATVGGDVEGAYSCKGSRVKVLAVSLAGALLEFYLCIGVDSSHQVGAILVVMSVRELSAPASHVDRQRRFVMCISGAISQLLMSKLFNAVEEG